MDASADDHAIFWLAFSLLTTIFAFAVGLWWMGLLDVLKELWRCIGDWAVVHASIRQVDCRPWGLERSFTISQGFAEKEPAESYPFGRTGLSLWNGGVALAKHLAEQRGNLRTKAFAPGKNVIEVGCGQGLVSMVVSELFDDLGNIVATDGSQDVLQSAEENLAENLGDVDHKIQLALLRWDDTEDMERILSENNGVGYDIILGSDITYMEDHSALMSTIVQVSHENTELWLTHEPRRRSTDALKASLHATFLLVEEFHMDLPHEETGRDIVPIVGWHCSGKRAA